MLAARVLAAIARIEMEPYAAGLLFEDQKYPGNFLCIVKGGQVIRIRWLDAGAAFEVLSVRSVFY